MDVSELFPTTCPRMLVPDGQTRGTGTADYADQRRAGLVRRVEGPRVGTIADHTRLPYLFNGRQMRLTDVYGELIPQIVASEIS